MYQRKLNTQITEPPKENKNIKLIVIASTVALTIILFYLYISLSSDDDNSSGELISVKPVSKETLSKDIDSILFTFGIRKEWIKESAAKENKTEDDKSKNTISKDVRIPNDLLTIELNYELTNYLRSRGIREKVTEDPKTKNLQINILPGSDSLHAISGRLNFIYSDTVKRTSSEVCLILDSIDYYPLAEILGVLDSPEKFSVLLPMRNDKADYQSAILESGKDYLIEFSAGDENDIAADFKSDMPEKVWKAKVKSVSMNNSAASGIIILNGRDQQEFVSIVSDEFTRNNAKVYKDTLYTPFRSGEEKINSLFENIISNTISGKKYLIYKLNFSPAEFSDYEKKVNQMKKLGYKFTDFKTLIKNQSK